MASLWLLNLSLKCIHHFAWPLVALLYPLCASVQAIETDSYQETRDLISYWVLLSLIYLFEYAFVRLLQRFLFWPYIKLMVISWLIMPDFGRASYVYNNLTRLFVSKSPQTVICWLNNRRMFSVKKDNFLLHAESYIKQNGTEALEKLVDSKSTAYKPDAEATNAIRAIDNEEMQQTNGKNFRTEPIDSKDLEEMEKKEIPAGNQDIPVRSNLAPGQKNTSSATEKTEGIAGSGTAIGELPERKVQKEWSALFQVTTSSEETLKHRSKLAPGQKNTSATEKTKGIAGSGTATGELPEGIVQKKWNCSLCQVTTYNEESWKSHLHGKKHRANCIALKRNSRQHVGTTYTNLRCKICNVTCPGVVDMFSHLNGKKHLENVKNLGAPPTNIESEK